MPIHKVSGGYKWGNQGKVYPTKSGAVKQAQAAYANGYKGDKAPQSHIHHSHASHQMKSK